MNYKGWKKRDLKILLGYKEEELLWLRRTNNLNKVLMAGLEEELLRQKTWNANQVIRIQKLKNELNRKDG